MAEAKFVRHRGAPQVVGVTVDLNAGYMVVFETRKVPGVANVVGSHDYALLNYDAVTKLFTIGNPWGATKIWVQDHHQVYPTPANPGIVHYE